MASLVCFLSFPSFHSSFLVCDIVNELGYLVPSYLSTVVRLNFTDLSLASIATLNLQMIDPTLNGFSSGFANEDGYGYLVPYKTTYGPVGGIYSNLSVDENHLEPYYHGRIVKFILSSLIFIFLHFFFLPLLGSLCFPSKLLNRHSLI